MSDIRELVASAAAGDQQAWHDLVGRFTRLLWGITRAYGLAPADAADVCQTTWLRLVERLDSLREPDRLGAWLATTARRECLRVLRRSPRPVDVDPLALPAHHADPAERVAAGEQVAATWAALHRLPDRCRRLLRLLAEDPPPTYVEISAALGMPIGSIGPTRARCRDRLRALVGAPAPTRPPDPR